MGMTDPRSAEAEPGPGAGAEAQPRAAAAPSPRKVPAKPRALPTIALALACFGLLFEFLAYRLHTGNDPAIGGSQAAAGSVTASSSPVVIRKRIVTDVYPARGGGAVRSASAPAAPPPPAPSVSAPAPAPAPAPIVTSTS